MHPGAVCLCNGTATSTSARLALCYFGTGQEARSHEMLEVWESEGRIKSGNVCSLLLVVVGQGVYDG
jgi:hypothetical protein